MLIDDSKSPENIVAAVALLSPIVPGITVKKLTAAIKKYQDGPVSSISEIPVTPAEAAKILKVSVYTVRRYVESGKLKGVRVGRFWRISCASINDMLGGTA